MFIATPVSIYEKERKLGEFIEYVSQVSSQLIGCGFTPVCSVFYKPVYDLGERSYTEWLDTMHALLTKSDIVLRLPGPSTGADREVAWANDNKLPVYYDVGELIVKEMG